MDVALVFGFLQAVTIAVITGLFHRENKERKKRQEVIEHREQVRAKESLLAMRLMSANTALTCVSARAIRDGKTNGDMAAALTEAEKAQREYFDLINSLAAENIHHQQ